MISSYYHSQKVQHNQLHATLLVLLIVCLVGVHLIVATPLHALSRTQVESSDVLSGDIAALQAEPEYRMLGSGINIAGFEFAGLTPPKHAYIDYYLGGHANFNLVRVPFKWSFIQPELYKDFDAKVLDLIKKFVDAILAKDPSYQVVLDLHNYARWAGQLLMGQEGIDMLYDLWRRVGLVYGGNDRVLFGLMNEPYGYNPASDWWDVQQGVVNKLRNDAKINNTLTVSGNYYSGLHNWGSANGAPAYLFTDPLDNYFIEVHQYLDQYSTGDDSRPCYIAKPVEKIFESFETWHNGYEAQTGRKPPRAFIGEWAAPLDATDCVSYYTSFAKHIYDNPQYYAGSTWWGGGPFRKDYKFLFQTPALDETHPALANLEPYLIQPFRPTPEPDEEPEPVPEPEPVDEPDSTSGAVITPFAAIVLFATTALVFISY